MRPPTSLSPPPSSQPMSLPEFASLVERALALDAPGPSLVLGSPPPSSSSSAVGLLATLSTSSYSASASSSSSHTATPISKSRTLLTRLKHRFTLAARPSFRLGFFSASTASLILKAPEPESDSEGFVPYVPLVVATERVHPGASLSSCDTSTFTSSSSTSSSSSALSFSSSESASACASDTSTFSFSSSAYMLPKPPVKRWSSTSSPRQRARSLRGVPSISALSLFTLPASFTAPSPLPPPPPPKCARDLPPIRPVPAGPIPEPPRARCMDVCAPICAVPPHPYSAGYAGTVYGFHDNGVVDDGGDDDDLSEPLLPEKEGDVSGDEQDDADGDARSLLSALDAFPTPPVTPPRRHRASSPFPFKTPPRLASSAGSVMSGVSDETWYTACEGLDSVGISRNHVRV
ncbi:unnamed protein product [Mycena citricolor]|uniref:Uncharacterized protein n=2 Tax=Mycena citricolor TaxID=2018698 RepID=A0AAD2K591_9AGAR|nr:unnamed protein product [Mycena citricolor]CAK5279669.1 unnamed protein product [Mycena citricolor]